MKWGKWYDTGSRERMIPTLRVFWSGDRSKGYDYYKGLSRDVVSELENKLTFVTVGKAVVHLENGAYAIMSKVPGLRDVEFFYPYGREKEEERKKRFIFAPAIWARDSSGNHGIVVCDWKLNPVSWHPESASSPIIEETRYDGDGQKHTVFGPWFVCPQVPVTGMQIADNTVWDTFSYWEEDHDLWYGLVHNDGITYPVNTSEPGWTSCLRQRRVYSGAVTYGFVDGSGPTYSVGISGYSDGITYLSEAGIASAHHNLGGAYWYDLPYTGYPQNKLYVSYPFAGLKSTLTNRCMAVLTDNWQQDWEYRNSMDQWSGTVQLQNSWQLVGALRAGDGVWESRYGYSAATSLTTADGWSAGGHYLSGFPKIYYEPVLWEDVITLNGQRFPDVATYSGYNSSNGGAAEVVLFSGNLNDISTLSQGQSILSPAVTSQKFYAIFFGADSFNYQVFNQDYRFNGLYELLSYTFLVALQL